MYAFMIQGLPAHPLIVHGAVVGIPLSALALLFYVLRPQSRAAWWNLVFGTMFVAWVFTLLAGSTGEDLEHALKHSSLIEDHTRLAGYLGVAVHVMSAAGAIMLLHDRFGARLSGGLAGFGRFLRRIAPPIVVVAAIASLVLVALTGHAGAKAAWHDSPAAAANLK